MEFKLTFKEKVDFALKRKGIKREVLAYELFNLSASAFLYKLSEKTPHNKLSDDDKRRVAEYLEFDYDENHNDNRTRPEHILSAAIWYNSKGSTKHVHQPKNVDYGYVMCGVRHSNIIGTSADVFGIVSKTNCIHGFITSKNRFVDRYEAVNVAFRAGQIIYKPPKLKSEDLY